MDIQDYERLNKKKREIPEELQSLRLRLHRAISWGRRAEQLSDDLDARFIFLWIGFNSLYAREPDAVAGGQDASKTFKEILEYLNVLVSLDKDRIHGFFWEGEIFEAGRLLVEDEYLFEFFWKSKTARVVQDKWREECRAHKRTFTKARTFNNLQKEKRMPKVLVSTVFNRLCVLRNQLIHGSATHDSGKNRNALLRGVTIMEPFLPVCINLMLKNPDKDWGAPRYRPDDKNPI